MHWIAVHEEVLGSKLRGFRKRVKCSEAEALGILTVLWLWARKNADITGLLGNADRDDVASAIRPYLSDELNAKNVTDALIKEGWIDEQDNLLYIHDWYEWQQYWYNYLDKKEKDKLRKRLERERQRESQPPEPAPKEEKQPVSDSAPEEDKPKKPPKKKYAESVSMREEEYAKLVETYGVAFTEKLIEELNNYKLANGKRYKEDYRAILNWVVEKCEGKYPQLRAAAKQAPKAPSGSNPFADYK